MLKLQPGEATIFGTSTHLPPPRRSLRAYLSVMSKFIFRESCAKNGRPQVSLAGGLDFHTNQTKSIFTFRTVVPFCHVGEKNCCHRQNVQNIMFLPPILSPEPPPQKNLWEEWFESPILFSLLLMVQKSG